MINKNISLYLHKNIKNKQIIENNYRYKIKHKSVHDLLMGKIYNNNKIAYYKTDSNIIKLAEEYQKLYNSNDKNNTRLENIIKEFENSFSKKKWIILLLGGYFCDNKGIPLYNADSEAKIQANIYQKKLKAKHYNE